MADVFVSYKREDETAVARLVKALRAEALSVWWDRDIPVGAAWEETIERAHAEARAIVVCWSAAAVRSENVKAEARHARGDNRLVQTFIEPCNPPMFFGERQGIDLSAWTGRADDPRFRAVAAAVRSVLDGSDTAPSLGMTGTRRRTRPFVLAGAGVGLAAAAVAGVLLTRQTPEAAVSRPAAAPTVDPATALLAKVGGSWGIRNECARRYLYAVQKDSASGERRIVVDRPGYHSEGRVVSAANGVILSEALEPAADRGNLIEIRPEPTQLVLQDRRTDTRQVLVRCP